MQQTQAEIQNLNEGDIFERPGGGVYEFIGVHSPPSVPLPSYDARRLIDCDKSTGALSRVVVEEGDLPVDTIDHNTVVNVLSSPAE